MPWSPSSRHYFGFGGESTTMILAIFFSRFHPEKGPIVQYQVPDGAIIPSSSPTVQKPLVDFASISDYIIPRQDFCGQPVTVCFNRYRVLGCPVCIVNPQKYERNEFIFNFALVLDEDTDISSYQSVVLKLARLFRSLEERESFLSLIDQPVQGTATGSGYCRAEEKVYALCEMILEDLNNYCECMIPIDEANTLNLKLFPTYPDPVPVKSWHVPLSTVRLEALVDSTWDLTMSAIVPFINGLNSVAVIARLADADLDLACEAISHLLYYGCILLLDIFQFAAVYAPTPELRSLFADTVTLDECSRYISTTGVPINAATILRLYTSLGHGSTLKAWCVDNRSSLVEIDVRRLITFGVIKGFLYRIHKYGLHPGSYGRIPGRGDASTSVGRDLSSRSTERNTQLSRYLNGLHSFDEVCTDFNTSEKSLLMQLKNLGNVQTVLK